MATKKVNIRAGAVNREIEVGDDVKTIKDLRAKLGRAGVTDSHQAYLKSDQGAATSAADDFAIEDGMSFEFSQNTGQKG